MIQKIKDFVLKVCLWCAISFMFIISLAIFSESFIAGSIALICGVVLIPKVSEKINENTNNKFSTKFKIIFYIICFLAVVFTTPTSEKSYSESKELSSVNTKSRVIYENVDVKNNLVELQVEESTEIKEEQDENVIDNIEDKGNQEFSIENSDNEEISKEAEIESIDVNTNLSEDIPVTNEPIIQNSYNANEIEPNEEVQDNLSVEEMVIEQNNYEEATTVTETYSEPVESYTTTQTTYSPNLSTSAYVLNTNTKKFHRSSCSSVKTIADHNREDSSEDRQEIINRGYDPCKRCNP